MVVDNKEMPTELVLLFRAFFQMATFPAQDAIRFGQKSGDFRTSLKTVELSEKSGHHPNRCRTTALQSSLQNVLAQIAPSSLNKVAHTRVDRLRFRSVQLSCSGWSDWNEERVWIIDSKK